MHKFSPRHRFPSGLLGHGHRPPKDSPLSDSGFESVYPIYLWLLDHPSQNLPQNKLYHANLLYIAPSPIYEAALENYHTNIDIEPNARYKYTHVKPAGPPETRHHEQAWCPNRRRNEKGNVQRKGACPSIIRILIPHTFVQVPGVTRHARTMSRKPHRSWSRRIRPSESRRVESARLMCGSCARPRGCLRLHRELDVHRILQGLPS